MWGTAPVFSIRSRQAESLPCRIDLGFSGVVLALNTTEPILFLALDGPFRWSARLACRPRLPPAARRFRSLVFACVGRFGRNRLCHIGNGFFFLCAGGNKRQHAKTKYDSCALGHPLLQSFWTVAGIAPDNPRFTKQAAWVRPAVTIAEILPKDQAMLASDKCCGPATSATTRLPGIGLGQGANTNTVPTRKDRFRF